MPNCSAFTKNATPCTAFGHIHGLCGRHAPMVSTPEKQIEFTRSQARLRARWINAQAALREAREAGVAPSVPVAPPAPPAPVAPAQGLCNHVKQNGQQCTHAARFPDGACTIHHNMIARREMARLAREATNTVRFRHRRGDTEAELDAYLEEVRPTLGEYYGRQIMVTADHLILQHYVTASRTLVNGGARAEMMTTVIQGWIALELISPRRGEMLARTVEMMIQWRDAQPPPRAPIPAHQREAQLAADGQNVHTAEISKQMRDSLEILLKVEIPSTQKETMHEIRESWRRMGKPESEIATVYRDMVNWWNKDTIFATGDRLYRLCVRGLWWTIKGYAGEVRAELEKRLWDECRDACVPYSVCTQGHMARLSNVMVGFDDAFVPPVPVGEILQQKMSAISEMEVDDDKKVELAKAVLEELKVPLEKHNDWLAAF